jgi:hypothetical protein
VTATVDGMAGRTPPDPSAVKGLRPAEPGVFSVYNWQSAAWEPLPTGAEVVRLQPAAPYFGVDGLVKVMVKAESGMMVRFVLPEMAVEGRVAE